MPARWNFCLVYLIKLISSYFTLRAPLKVRLIGDITLGKEKVDEPDN